MTEKQSQGRSNPGLHSAIVLSLVLCLLVFVADVLTRDRIRHNRQMSALGIIEEVMPLDYDNALYQDWVDIDSLSTRVYRARKDGNKVGVVFMPVTSKGYNAEIRAAVGVRYDGSLAAVRIIEQHETPGLGDQVHQRKSNWIQGFRDHSLANTPSAAWAVKTENGNFDAISGATISPRAVINSVREVLQYYQSHRDELYEN